MLNESIVFYDCMRGPLQCSLLDDESALHCRPLQFSFLILSKFCGRELFVKEYLNCIFMRSFSKS